MLKIVTRIQLVIPQAINVLIYPHVQQLLTISETWWRRCVSWSVLIRCGGIDQRRCVFRPVRGLLPIMSAMGTLIRGSVWLDVLKSRFSTLITIWKLVWRIARSPIPSPTKPSPMQSPNNASRYALTAFPRNQPTTSACPIANQPQQPAISSNRTNHAFSPAPRISTPISPNNSVWELVHLYPRISAMIPMMSVY